MANGSFTQPLYFVCVCGYLDIYIYIYMEKIYIRYIIMYVLLWLKKGMSEPQSYIISLFKNCKPNSLCCYILEGTYLCTHCIR